MYLIHCLNAYLAASQLAEKELDYQTAHALVKLKHQLQPHVDFYCKEEMKLVEKYAKKDENGNTLWTDKDKFTLTDDAAAKEFAKKKADLGLVKIDEKWEVIKAPAIETIKGTQLEALEGFIEFGGE